jgi:hypothetical protein
LIVDGQSKENLIIFLVLPRYQSFSTSVDTEAHPDNLGGQGALPNKTKRMISRLETEQNFAMTYGINFSTARDEFRH